MELLGIVFAAVIVVLGFTIVTQIGELRRELRELKGFLSESGLNSSKDDRVR